MTILDAIADPQLFGPWFKDRATWRAWLAFLATLFGLPMDATDRRHYRACTGRTKRPRKPVTEAWLVVGRRGGKSFVLALVAVFLACFKDWRPYLTPGERAVVMVIAVDRKQARVILSYVRALLQNIPMLRRMVAREMQEAIELNNGVAIEIQTCSFRAIRGFTVVAALLDEVAFWRSDDSANPDTEILTALRPAMATVPGAMLLAASSPYAKRGALYQAHKAYYGKDDAPALVWQAPTRTMNPTIPKRVIDEAHERDPASADSEFGAQFRKDIEAFLPSEIVAACTVPGRLVLPPISANRYVGFVDPSGGSQDSMTLGIAHREEDRPVLDLVTERRPPFSPEAVTEEFADILKAYRLKRVTGDRYAGEWPRERFRAFGITYDLADKPKSDIYRAALPDLTSGKAELLENRRLAAQLTGLERRTARGGRDSIDHAPGAHDDVANVALGALWLASKPRGLGGVYKLGGMH